MSLVERFVVGVDMRRYSGRTARQQLLLQRELAQMLRDAAAAAGLDRDSWDCRPEGDGELAVIPADVDLVAIVRKFVTELDQRLTDHNEDHARGTNMRLRVAMHMDSLAPSPLGYIGQGLVVTQRLLDSEPVRAALETSPGANLAQIISLPVYERAVKPELGGLRPRQFQTVNVDIPAKDFRQVAYLYVPHESPRPQPKPPPSPDPPRFPFHIAANPPAPQPEEPVPTPAVEQPPPPSEPAPLDPALREFTDKIQAALDQNDLAGADALTTLVLLESAGRTAKGALRDSDAGQIPDALLTALDAAWSGFSDGAWGFAAQCKRLDGLPLKRRGDFWALSVRVGWRGDESEVVPRYEWFVKRGDRTAPFYPTLRNPERERHSEWHDEWLSTVLSVYVRLQTWER